MKQKIYVLLLLLLVITLTSCKQTDTENNQETLQLEKDSTSAINLKEEENTIGDDLDLESKISEAVEKRLETLELSEETKDGLIDDILSVVEENIQATIDSSLDDISYTLEENLHATISDMVSSEVNKKVNIAVDTAINGKIQSNIDQAVSQIEPAETNVIEDKKPQTVVDGTSITCNPGEIFDWIVNHNGVDYNIHIKSFEAKIYNVDFFELSKNSQRSHGYSKYRLHITYTGVTDPSLQNNSITFFTMTGLGIVGDSVSGAKIAKDGSFNGEKDLPINFIPEIVNFRDLEISSY